MTDRPLTGPQEPWLRVTASREFPDWLAAQQVSLAVSTYQAGKLILLGRNPAGGLSVFERTLDRCMGLTADEGTLWVGTAFQVWRFENILRPGGDYQGHDRLYVPRTGHTTGDLDAHDLAVAADGSVVFAATKFNCLARLHPVDSFEPVWRPPFVSRLVAEDRCHLNGFALVDGEPGYVTVVAATDVVDGWRDRRRAGGLVLNVPAGDVVCDGLSMPHSPRWHAGKLWVLDGGSGHVGFVDPAGRFEPVAFVPGFLRGLAFVGGYAVVGSSLARHEGTFTGLPLDDHLTARNADPRCGLSVVDLASGAVVHWVRVEGLVTELYDVAVLAGAVRPAAVGFQSDEVRRIVTVPDPVRW